jgi:hypothetical protein
MLKPGEEPQEGGPTALTGAEFWEKVAGVDEADLRAVLSRGEREPCEISTGTG